MGKVTIYCQLSGCSPEVEDHIKYWYETTKHGSRVVAAFNLLTPPDEAEGHQALTIIGPLADDKKTWLEIGSIEEALAQPEGRVRAIPGCSMGNMFDLGFCDGPNGGPNGAIISFGSCFYVLTFTLPILEAATGGRVSIRRLWDLSMMKGHIKPQNHHGPCLSGVDYGPIEQYWDQFPWMFGGILEEELPALNEKESPEEIAEIIRSRGYWIWMRPDRFPIELPSTPQTSQNIIPTFHVETVFPNSISVIPLEIFHSVVSYLPISDVASFAMASKSIYSLLLGADEARGIISNAYVRLQAPWFLPHGEAELKWWNDRGGDKALGWEYLKRCYTQSHSMRNRRRIWRAAESIEEECEKEERLRASET